MSEFKWPDREPDFTVKNGGVRFWVVDGEFYYAYPGYQRNNGRGLSAAKLDNKGHFQFRRDTENRWDSSNGYNTTDMEDAMSNYITENILLGDISDE